MKAVAINRILFFLLLFIQALPGVAQKVFYAPEAENWQQNFSKPDTGFLYAVYLLGDIKNSEAGRKNLQMLNRYINKDGDKSAVVVLGDIVYPRGLPDTDNKGFADAEKNLKQVLHTFDHYKGKVFFLPGNHDWDKGGKTGWESVKNEEKYIERYFNGRNVYLPDGGCPGPVELELTPDITLVLFDSQWWFQKNAKPEGNASCGFANQNELFLQIEDILRRNKDKKVLFATHHPLFSVGEHGGYFPASYLLFPLLEFQNWMYFPLPGFLYVGYRKYLGNIQDLAHPVYKEFRKSLLAVFQNYPHLIYAAGHEHNMEYFYHNGLHHIISGGGGKPTYVADKKKKAVCACQNTGFTRLSYYKNGEVWMEFIAIDSSAEGKILFGKKLFSQPLPTSSKSGAGWYKSNFSDSVVRVPINLLYNEAGKFHRFMMGNTYRNIWAAPVTLPVFDIGKEKGGLTIIKRGGGMQTHSVRLKDKNGREYVLRSVNKYVENALPPNLRNTIAVKPLQDAISASNPFAALTIPVLADAAGVMHTHPKLFWVPDDPRLGIYRKELANGVFLFEERPAGNWSDMASFGFSPKIVSTAKVIKKTEEDHKHQVDQKAVVRARLFDMFVNDWDRHDDQWRWASFKKNGKTIYRPIPRDRDQVYFVNEGFVMGLTKHFWPTRKFQGFGSSIKDIKGLMYNARYFDRSFMTEPDLNSWLSIASQIKNRETDTVIHRAIKQMPENIYDSVGQEIENKLKARRERLPFYARQYYLILSKKVDVVGTNKRELFDVQRRKNGNTQVEVFGLSGKSNKPKSLLYQREFKYTETKEIRLYGLAGKDVFHVTGTGKKGITVRIIGGKGNDSIVDQSKVKGLTKKTIVYDRKDKANEIVGNGETRLQLSKNKAVNAYNRKQFKYNRIMPIIWAGYNIDDGVFLGGGVKINRYNFRDSTIQKIKGNLAFQTGAFALSYEGLFSAFSPFFDLLLKADLSFPRNVDNFFGLGNETPKITDDKKYYRVRYKYARLNPMLHRTVNQSFSYGLGAFYQYFMVTDTAGRFIGEIYKQLLDSTAYLSHHYVGLRVNFLLDTRNNPIIPHRGVKWEAEGRAYYSLDSYGKNFVKLRSDISFYLSFRKDPRVVFAFRFGGAANFGHYEFFHTNFLGGKTNLRGFRSNRFAGDIAAYQNTEIRLKIGNIKSYVLNGQWGVAMFNDIGRVWVKNENSSRWHDGYGLGVWLIPFNFTALTLTYSRSNEDRLVNFTFRYLF